MPERILILSASVGAGHMRAAEAVELALRAIARANVRIVNHDILTLMSRAFTKIYKDAYLDMVSRAPQVFGWLYQATDKPFKKNIPRMALEEANARRFFKMLRDFDPDLCICTHFLPASLIDHERRKGRAGAKIATVITDLDIHGLWLATPSDHYFVAIEEAKVHLGALGLADSIIDVTGIPVHPVFSETKDRAAMRRKHGLHPDLPAILLSTGGFGVGNVAELVERLLQLKTPVQIAVMCGRSAPLKASIERMAAKRPPGAMPIVKAIGFTTEMDEWMSAADLLLGKPGGLTTSESFTKGLAWAVVNPIPGQEERNAIHMLEAGVGIWCNNPRTLAFKVDRLLGDAGRLAAARSAALRLARPEAGRAVAERCLEM